MPLSTSDSGPGSLRACIEIANTQGDTVIDMRELRGRIALESPLPPVIASIQFLGPEEGSLVISGERKWPILAVAAGSTTSLERITLTEAVGSNYVHGAAIANAGSLTMKNCLVATNLNDGGWGAGIFNRGSLVLLDCEFRGNIARGEEGGSSLRPGGAGGGAAGMGGAVFHDEGRLWASNIVFAGNQAIGGNGGTALGTRPTMGSGRGGGPFGGVEGAYAAAGAGGFGSGGGGGTGAHQFPFPGIGGFGGGAGGAGGVRENGGGAPGGFGGGATRAAMSGGGGGAAMGAALFARAGEVTVLDSFFEANLCKGGDGGSGGYGAGAGGSGSGGAIFGYAAELIIRGCTLLNNAVSGGAGGLIETPEDSYIRWSEYGGAAGGAGILLHEGSLELDLSLIASNFVQGSPDGLSFYSTAGVAAQGAGLAVYGGSGTARQCTFSANLARGGDAVPREDEINPSGSAAGGGVSITSGDLTLENCTLSGNRVMAGDTVRPEDESPGLLGTAWGGAVAVDGNGSVTTPLLAMRFCTVASNKANPGSIRDPESSETMGLSRADGSQGGGCFETNGVLRLEGVIIAWNQATTDADLSGIVESHNRNLVLDPGNASGLRSEDITGIDPLISQLTYRGGRTPIHVLSLQSPAIDAAEPAEGVVVDQRNVGRPRGERFDLGAFELDQPDFDSLSIAKWTLDGDTMEFELRGSGDVIWQTEFSPDLIHWHPVGPTIHGSSFLGTAESPTGYYRVRLLE